MTKEERIRILGPEAAARFEEIADRAPPPTPEQIALLRRIFAPVAARRAAVEGTAA